MNRTSYVTFTLSPLMPIAVAIVALAVRAIGIGSRSFWLDEGFSTWLADQPIDVIMSFPDYHPPLYYLVIRVWESLGTWFGTDAGVRMISAIASALSIGIATWIVQRICPMKTSLVAIYGVLSPMSVWYAQEARMYALTSFAVTGAVGVLLWIHLDLRTRRSPRVRHVIAWTAFVGLSLTSMYSHYDGVIVTLTSSATFFLLNRHRRSALGAWSVANLALIVGYVPQFCYAVSTMERTGDFHLAARIPLIAALIIAATIGLVILVLVARTARNGGSIVGCSIGAFGLTLAAIVEMSTFGSSLTRHATIVLPLLIVGAAYLFARCRCAPFVQWIAIIACLPPLFMVLFVHQKEQWRETAALLEAQVGSNDSVLLYQGYTLSVLGRYYHGLPTITPIQDPGEVAAMTNAGLLRPRVWLIESHTGESASLAPVVAQTRTRLTRTDLYRISVESFEIPSAYGGETTRPGDSLSQTRSAR